MPQWVVFDPETAKAIKPFAGTDVLLAEAATEDALTLGLAALDAVVVMPASTAADVLLLKVHQRPAPRETMADEPGRSYVATGFLGLVDEPVYEEGPQPRKKWWQKLLD